MQGGLTTHFIPRRTSWNGRMIYLHLELPREANGHRPNQLPEPTHLPKTRSQMQGWVTRVHSYNMKFAANSLQTASGKCSFNCLSLRINLRRLFFFKSCISHRLEGCAVSCCGCEREALSPSSTLLPLPSTSLNLNPALTDALASQVGCCTYCQTLDSLLKKKSLQELWWLCEQPSYCLVLFFQLNIRIQS